MPRRTRQCRQRTTPTRKPSPARLRSRWMSRTLPRRRPGQHLRRPPTPETVNLKSLSTLQVALGLSILVHAGVLTLRIVDPEGFNRVFQDTPLEVVLVNAHTNEKVDKAQAIAQRTLAGGGEAEKG